MTTHVLLSSSYRRRANDVKGTQIWWMNSKRDVRENYRHVAPVRRALGRLDDDAAGTLVHALQTGYNKVGFGCFSLG